MGRCFNLTGRLGSACDLHGFNLVAHIQFFEIGHPLVRSKGNFRPTIVFLGVGGSIEYRRMVYMDHACWNSLEFLGAGF